MQQHATTSPVVINDDDDECDITTNLVDLWMMPPSDILAAVADVSWNVKSRNGNGMSPL